MCCKIGRGVYGLLEVRHTSTTHGKQVKAWSRYQHHKWQTRGTTVPYSEGEANIFYVQTPTNISNQVPHYANLFVYSHCSAQLIPVQDNPTHRTGDPSINDVFQALIRGLGYAGVYDLWPGAHVDYENNEY